jgi:hypothetical protein
LEVLQATLSSVHSLYITSRQVLQYWLQFGLIYTSKTSSWVVVVVGGICGFDSGAAEGLGLLGCYTMSVVK